MIAIREHPETEIADLRFSEHIEEMRRVRKMD